MKGFGDLYKSEKKKNIKNKFSNEQIINQAIQFHLRGNILEAAKVYQKLISQGCNDQRVLTKYGSNFTKSRQIKRSRIVISQSN